MRQWWVGFIFLSSSIFCETQPFSPLLVDLFEEMGVSHNTLPETLDQIQREWIQPSKDDLADLIEDQRSKVLDLATDMGLFKEISPSRPYYDYAFLWGKTIPDIQKKLTLLLRLIEKGLKVRQIVILTGLRILNPKTEVLSEICDTEEEAVQILWKLAPLSEEVKKIAVTFCNTPMIIQEGKTREPDDRDKIATWLATHPKVGKCLLLSIQPYSFYERALFRSVVPQEFKVEVAAERVHPQSQNAAVVLDLVGRWLTEIYSNTSS